MYGIRFSRLAAALSLAIALIAASPPDGRAEERIFRSDLTLGYDSFIDRFTILEEDTSDTVQEIYLSLGSRLSLRPGPMKLGASNSLRFGNQTVSD